MALSRLIGRYGGNYLIRNIMSAIEIEEILSRKINMSEIKTVVAWATGNSGNLLRLWNFACSDERRTSVNALWTITHLPETDSNWVSSLRDDMIDMLLVEGDSGKKRLMLQILRELEYDKENIRTDFLDYCMSKINSECESYAVRCFSLYTAFKMCRHYPELIAELENHLDMMSFQSLSPGLKSALRQTESKIKRIKKR